MKTAIEIWNALPEKIRERVPSEDAWAIREEDRYARWIETGHRRKELAERLLDPRNPNLLAERTAFKHACAADPVRFMRNCIWTRDPEGPITRPRELPLVPLRFQIDNWVKPWHDGLYQRRQRCVHEKTRRNLFTITLAAFATWGFRFIPGWKNWFASYEDSMVDNLDEWDSLFAKVRYMWTKCVEFYPWLFPVLPDHTDVNKKGYLKFPEWRDGGHEIDRACWGNEILGLNPSDVAGRGRGCGWGAMDEASWVDELEATLDSIESMTPHLVLGGTPPKNAQHPFAIIVKQGGAWLKNTAHWTHNAGNIENIRWDPEAETRGPWTEKWRNPWYERILEENRGREHIVSRNYDLDYEASASGRVFLGFMPSFQVGSTDPAADDYDLYDPSWPLYCWFDTGRGDPWAWWWVQISDQTGEIRVVDYYMRDDVTVDYFAPMIGGWNFDQRASWLTAPDRLPWRQAVPWRYTAEEERIIRRWYGRVRPKWLRGDDDVKSRHGSSLHTMATILGAYKHVVISSSMAHNREKWIEHANACLPHVRISGFLKNYRPKDRWPSAEDVFMYWSRLASTEAGREAKPRHDDYSHPGTAFVYGCQQIAQPKPAFKGNPHKPSGRTVDTQRFGVQTARKSPTRDRVGW